MAGKPTLRRKKYYSRVNIPLGKNNYKQLWYPLNTESRKTANSRWYEIQKFEAQIKEYGRDFKMSWQTKSGNTEIEQYNIIDAVKDYIQFKQSEGLKVLTIERIEIALNHLIEIVGDKVPVSDLSVNHIDLFKQHFQNKHVPTTININLDKISTFLKWLNIRGKIDNQIIFTKLKENKPMPRYITEIEWQQIMELDKVYRKNTGYYDKIDEHWKRAFYFYRETGCRLIEPFVGTLENNWLTVNANDSKTGIPRIIHVEDPLISIYNEMMDRFLNSDSNNPRGFSQSYSRKFKYACMTIGIDKHFHCLRHTYAIRRYLQTNDIYKVKNELGHSSVRTTEIYMKFDSRKLFEDFPILIGSSEKDKIDNKYTESYTDHRTQSKAALSTIVGRG